MPLSTPVPRQMLHRRVVQCTGYRREDGLWDIEGHMVDTKTYSVPNEDRGGVIQAGEPLHEMWIRLTVDEESFVGTGLGLFAAVLDRYFGMYVHANSFTRLTVVSARTQEEVVTCQPRNGDITLL